MPSHSLACCLLLAPLAAQTTTRIHDDVVRTGTPAATDLPATAMVVPSACATLPQAQHGQAVPGGGTLVPIAFSNPASINRAGQMAFVANVNGAARNQGIFVADAGGLHAIAMGCGSGGGSGAHGTCGDPAPGGGTFAGFFGGTVFVPPIDDAGDVLFFADVIGGPSPRGLFLFDASTQTIQKVAAVGDPSPTGGTFGAVGPGSLNNRRQVAFLGRGPTGNLSNLYLWSAGALTKIAATGDAAPGGGTITLLGTESFGFVDGTNVPAGPVPSINDCGQIAFRAIVSGGITSRGIVVRTGGVDTWYLKAGDPTPAGGTYSDFQGAALNGHGAIAVFADFNNGGPNSGWFTGAPGGFRKVMAFGDPVDGGTCQGLAFSRNPMTPIDDDGNVVMWCSLGTNLDRLVLVDTLGATTVLGRRGGPTPLGGTYSSINAWPSLASSGRATLSSGTPGAGASLSAHFASVLCGPALATSPCVQLGGNLRIDNYGPLGGLFAVAVASAPANVPVPPLGTLLIAPPLEVLYAAFYPGTSGAHEQTFVVPPLPAYSGVTLYFQSLALGAPTDQLTNATSTLLQ